MSTHQKHSLIFCPDCGSLLDPPTTSETAVQCHLCSCLLPSAAFDSLEVVTQSSVTAFTTRPMPKKKNTGDEDSMAHLRDGATIKERCPKCDAPEMVFHTAQLRSADEGQTVFYSCVKCGFKEKLNS
ncbi:DNA-directed RNA polymerase I core subunit rpa12 [Chytriomyces hyalinus]|nr:DNA-directed RNA polymerase I core subunit rpa12 [Chytriomyces hyalinus]